jgi:SsrA-binding protein
VEVTGSGLVVARNRKARHDYFIEDTFEAGIVLSGSEVKSLRGGRANITDAYAVEKGGEIWLINAHLPEYAQANRFGHETRRPRKLLLHRRQVNRLMGAVNREGKTLVALSIYFNPRGRAKVELALAHGKKAYDKRATIKEREWQRDKQRLMRPR